MPPLIAADGTTEDATAIVPIVRLTTAIGTADGIMDTTMYTAVSSGVTKVAAAWIKKLL